MNSVNTPGGLNGAVTPTLQLSLGSTANFGALTAGIGQDYLASVSATVTSTAGDATLTITDPNANAGHLVNGAFTLANALQANATDGAHPTGVFAPITANPLVLLTYSAPISLDAVTVNLKQTVGANEPLRTGAYSKTLTFTLSTTTP